MSRRKSQLLTYLAYLVLLFLLVAYKAGPSLAAIFVAAGVLGYLNVFAVLHAALSVFRGHPLTRPTILLVAVGVVGSVVLFAAGYWPPLAICTGSFLVIDGVALRFRGQPVGASPGEP